MPVGSERLSMNKKQKNGKKNIEPGMVVEATGGELGEEDVSKPKVTGVVQDQQSKVEKLIVQKGVIFKKSLEDSSRPYSICRTRRHQG
jgi:hypothetical protein